MMPSGQPHPEVTVEPLVPNVVEQPRYRWYQKVSAVLLVTFCLEVGFFLLIFPWTEAWETNFFSSLIPQWHRHWDNLYFRGAVSGLGVVNLYIALLELFRLRRFARN